MTAIVYILLPVHNRREITRKFIDCLKAQRFGQYHLVLIDDGSVDGTTEMVRQHISFVTVLRGEGRWWWAGSLQRGIQWLEEKNIPDSAIVLFINDDVTFSPDYLARAIRAMWQRQGILMLSRFKCTDDTSARETGIVADLKRLTFRLAATTEQINCLSTRGLFARWGDVKKIGHFRPKFLPHYLSDYEYTIRASKMGLHCETSPDVVVCPNDETTGYHAISESSTVAFVKKYFSIKSPSNPIYLSSFVIMACPKIWILPNIARIWLRAGGIILKRALSKSLMSIP